MIGGPASGRPGHGRTGRRVSESPRSRRPPGEVPVSGVSLAHIVPTAIAAPGRPAADRLDTRREPAFTTCLLIAINYVRPPVPGAPSREPRRTAVI